MIFKQVTAINSLVNKDSSVTPLPGFKPDLVWNCFSEMPSKLSSGMSEKLSFNTFNLCIEESLSVSTLIHSIGFSTIEKKNKTYCCEGNKAEFQDIHSTLKQSKKKSEENYTKFWALWTPKVAIMMALIFFSGCDSLQNSKKILLRGKRISLYQEDHISSEKVAFSKEKFQAPVKNLTQWTQPGLNSEHHMGSLALEGNPSWPLTLIWKKSVSKEVLLPVAPIATQDCIFILNDQGFLSALDWQGKALWSTQVNCQSDCYGMGGGLATDGQRVYVTTPHRWVLALNYATGKVVWSYALNHPARNGPALHNNRIAVLTLANQTILLDCTTGKEIWDDQGLREDTLLLGGSVPAITKDRVIIGTTSGEVIALSLGQGERLWDQQLASIHSTEGEKNFRHIHAYPVVVDNRVYATSESGQMVCFELYSGDVLWSQDGAGGMQTPVVVGDTLITLTTTGRCLAIDRHSGKEFWRISLPSNQTWFGPVVAGGLIHILSDKGQLHIIDPLKKGACVGFTDLKDTYTMAPIVMRGGLLFFSKKGHLSFYRRQYVIPSVKSS